MKIWAETSTFSSDFFIVYKKKKWEENAHQVKKGNTWHYGGKAHIGVNKDRRLSHIAKVT